MSIFSKIWKGVRKVAGPVIGGLIGGPAGAVVGTALAGGAARAAPAATKQLVPVATRVLPGGGAVSAGVAAAGLGGLGALTGARMARQAQIDPATGLPKRKRRRRRGITYTELKNHRRVETFLQKNYKCKSGGTRGSYVRKRRG